MIRIEVELELELEGKIHRGSSTGSDLVRCSILAWLEAAAGFSSGGEGIGRVRTLPFQVSGLDENDDLWIFDSEDEGAARAIEEEFIGEGYSEIRLLV